MRDGTAALPDGPTRWWIDGPDDGPAVALVHGFTLPAYNWEPLVARLNTAGLRTLRFDLYGRGSSARLPRRVHDWRLYVDQLDALLDELGWDGPVALLGHSMGGHIAARFAIAHPTRVTRLCLIAPLVHPPPRWLVAPLWLPILGRRYIGRRYLPAMRDRQTTPERTRRFAEQMDDGFTRAILSTIRHFPRWPGARTFRELAALGLPVTLVWSRDDEDVPFAHGQALADEHGFALAAFDDLGHSPHVLGTDAAAGPIAESLRG